VRSAVFTNHWCAGIAAILKVIEPHKYPFKTLSASFVMKNQRPLMTITLMGGDMQAQGHAQIFVNILELGTNMQGGFDMARFRHNLLLG
jgi:gamma-glutamyltranspeptidase/glutathione hydrolase